MPEQIPPLYVNFFACSRCQKPLKSPQPVRLGHAMARCPHCHHEFRVETGISAPEAPATADEPAVPQAGDTGSSAPDVTPAAVPFRAPMAPRPSSPPEVTGYTLLGELGRGGMGVVFKARHEKLKRIVALKMLAAGNAQPEELARFSAEAEAVARLHHPNIIQIFEIGEQNGQPWLALEFVGGGTLRTRTDGQQQPVRPAAQLVEMLARAIHAAHLRGIVHRDLKPANILLARPTSLAELEGEVALVEAVQLFGVPKITDFGLAKRLDEDTGSTRHGEIIGTQLYMAPEQARGKSEQIGPAVDVYALGAILYELLTGCPPFQADNTMEVLLRLATEQPRPPRQLRKGLSRNLETICLKCLEKDPRKRYASALALADDLQRYLKGEPIRARPVSLPMQLWSWCLRNPVPASLLLTVSLVLLVGLWHLSRLEETLIRAKAEKDAEQQTLLLKETMTCYSDVVVRGAQRGGLQPRHDFRNEKGGIPFPYAFTLELCDVYKKNAEIAMEVRLYSDYRFRFRGPAGTNHLDDWEKAALQAFRGPNPPRAVKSFTSYKRISSLRYATPVLMGQKCVDCHNSHPESQKKDWEVGDVRGVIEVIRPLAGDIEDTRERLRGTWLLLGGTAATLLLLCGVVLAIGRRQR